MKIWWFKAKLKVEVYTLWTKSFITIQIINVTFNVIYNITIHEKIVIRTPSTYKCTVQCNYKMFCYVLGYIVKAYTMSSRYIVKAIHLEKTKCLIIWMEGSMRTSLPQVINIYIIYLDSVAKDYYGILYHNM